MNSSLLMIVKHVAANANVHAPEMIITRRVPGEGKKKGANPYDTINSFAIVPWGSNIKYLTSR